MSDLVQDLRYGLRNLVKTPGFFVAAVLALGLGIGATTAIFSLVDGVVLRPLPYTDPERLVSLWEANRDRGLSHEPISPVNFVDYRALSQVFEDAAAWWRPEITLQGADREPLRVNTVEASGNLFAVMGVAPALGAGFPPATFSSRERIAVISHRLWQSRFDADPKIVGKMVRLNDDDHVIAGVMPAGFNYPGETDVWQRLVWDLARHSRGAHFMEAVARLRPGVTLAQAQRELDALSGRLGGEFAGTNRGWVARAIALHEEVVGYYRPGLYVLLGAVALLLLIACINVASLLLARSASRSREVAIRAAVGATRPRLVRQLLSENLILAALGGLTGLAVAFGATRLIIASTPMDIPRLAQVGLDLRVLGFAAMLALGTVMLFGLLPALFTARVDLQHVLKDGGRGQGGSQGRRRAHSTLVAAEVALAVTLLIGAAMLLRAVSTIAAEDPGFDPAGVLTAGVQLNGAAYRAWPAVEQFHFTLVESLRQQPGVVAAGAANFLPLAPGWRIGFSVQGAPPPRPGDEPTAQYHSVTDGYFEALGVPLLRGRLFDAHDTASSRGVVVVNEAFVRRYLPNEDPVGKTILSLATQIGPLGASLMKDRAHVVIGVVQDVKNMSLQTPAEPAIYHSMRQFPFRHVYLVVRGTDDARVAEAIVSSVRRADAAQPRPDLRGMANVIGESFARPQFLMFVMWVFAASAVALAGLGIYGLLAYTVAERQQELSIRLALGARPGGVLLMIVGQGLRLAIAGSVAGLAIAYLAARNISSMLYGVRPDDPAVLAAGVAVAVCAAVAACLLPAMRAARLDPIAGLRE
jgi:putative ABC transport system permease protein